MRDKGVITLGGFFRNATIEPSGSLRACLFRCWRWRPGRHALRRRIFWFEVES